MMAYYIWNNFFKKKNKTDEKMEEHFIAVPEDDNENWWICRTGTYGNGDWNVVTNHIHGSDVPDLVRNADTCAKLIARLLNWYYSDKSNEKIIEESI